MKKVVFNNCYGGFGLSPKAVKRYYELTQPETTLYFYQRKWGNYPEEIYTKIENPVSEFNTAIFTKDFGESFTMSNWKNAPYSSEDVVYCSPDRSDPALIQVVEELGEAANGDCANLKIAEVPGKYRICEYDGNEWIETPESIEWCE